MDLIHLVSELLPSTEVKLVSSFATPYFLLPAMLCVVLWKRLVVLILSSLNQVTACSEDNNYAQKIRRITFTSRIDVLLQVFEFPDLPPTSPSYLQPYANMRRRPSVVTYAAPMTPSSPPYRQGNLVKLNLNVIYLRKTCSTLNKNRHRNLMFMTTRFRKLAMPCNHHQYCSNKLHVH